MRVYADTSWWLAYKCRLDSMLIRSMDLFHVAIALEIAADSFLSFDQDQNALAAAAGLPLMG